jgi:L-rhamnose mutarotase
MPRVAFKMQLLPGKEEEYQKRHDEIWPELEAAFKDRLALLNTPFFSIRIPTAYSVC